MTFLTRTLSTITTEGARAAVRGALDAARERQVPASVAVTDPSGTLVAFVRMDDAPLLTVRLAQDKAHTAIQFGVPTHHWYDLIKDDPALLTGIPHVPGMVIFGGGLPIRVEAALVGGIGVSGGTPADDVAIAEAGLAAFLARS